MRSVPFAGVYRVNMMPQDETLRQGFDDKANRQREAEKAPDTFCFTNDSGKVTCWNKALLHQALPQTTTPANDMVFLKAKDIVADELKDSYYVLTDDGHGAHASGYRQHFTTKENQLNAPTDLPIDQMLEKMQRVQGVFIDAVTQLTERVHGYIIIENGFIHEASIDPVPSPPRDADTLTGDGPGTP